MSVRQTRLYSLFQIEKLSNGRKRYFPASDLALPKQAAVRVFQNRLLDGAFGCGPVVELRPIQVGRKSQYIGY